MRTKESLHLVLAGGGAQRVRVSARRGLVEGHQRVADVALAVSVTRHSNLLVEHGEAAGFAKNKREKREHEDKSTHGSRGSCEKSQKESRAREPCSQTATHRP